MADRVAVMFAVKLWNMGLWMRFSIIRNTYTHGDFNSMPTIETESGSLEAIPGTPQIGFILLKVMPLLLEMSLL